MKRVDELLYKMKAYGEAARVAVNPCGPVQSVAGEALVPPKSVLAHLFPHLDVGEGETDWDALAREGMD